MADERQPLTARQVRILDVIRTTVRDRGYPPTLRELSAAVDISSSSTAFEQLRILEARGYIRRSPNTPRGIMLLDPTDDPTLTDTGHRLLLEHHPASSSRYTCPGCGKAGLEALGITRLGYVFDVCTCREGTHTFDHLIEQLWHRTCLARSGCP